MQPGALRTLEFDRIVDAICRYAQTPPGATWLARMQPMVEAQAVAEALSATTEAVRFLGDNQIGLRAPSDLDDILAALAVEAKALVPGQLLALAGFLASVDATCASVRRARAAFPILRRIADAA